MGKRRIIVQGRRDDACARVGGQVLAERGTVWTVMSTWLQYRIQQYRLPAARWVQSV